MSNLPKESYQNTDAIQRAERVLHKHGVKDYEIERRSRARPRMAIDAIIRDIKAANAEAEE